MVDKWTKIEWACHQNNWALISGLSWLIHYYKCQSTPWITFIGRLGTYLILSQDKQWLTYYWYIKVLNHKKFGSIIKILELTSQKRIPFPSLIMSIGQTWQTCQTCPLSLRHVSMMRILLRNRKLRPPRKPNQTKRNVITKIVI